MAATLILLIYSACDYRLSRRGLEEAPRVGLDGFLYVRFAEAAAAEDLTAHRWLALFFAPANRVDRLFNRGHYPVDCIMWRLSG